MANGAVRIVKIFLYLVVIASTAAMLYGFVKASSSIERCLFGGSNCMLFGRLATYNSNTSSAVKNCSAAADLPSFSGFQVPVGYNEDLCRFCMASAAMQLIVSLAGVLVVYYRLSTGKPGRTGCSVLELLVVIVLAFAALLTSGLVTAGLEVYCRNLLGGWEKSFMHTQLHFDMPVHCAAAPLFRKGDTSFYFGMHLARTCSFVAAGAWVLHLIISSISAHSYRKNGATPVEEVQSEQERRRRNKEKKAMKKKEKDLDKKSKSVKSKSGKQSKPKSMWDESAAMV